MAENDSLCAFDDGVIDWQHFINNSKQSIERRLNRVTTFDRHIAMQNFLEHLSIRHEPLAFTQEFLKQPLCVRLMRMGRTDEIHRDIRVDENHGRGPIP